MLKNARPTNSKCMHIMKRFLGTEILFYSAIPLRPCWYVIECRGLLKDTVLGINTDLNRVSLLKLYAIPALVIIYIRVTSGHLRKSGELPVCNYDYTSLQHF